MKANSLVIGTLLFAMLLTIVPFPAWMLWARPEFTLIVLMYWALAMPDRFGLLAAMVAGLFQDSLTASLIGKHMLTYTVVISFILFTYQRLRMFGVWQQAVFVFGLLCVERGMEYWIAVLSGQSGDGSRFILSAMVGALLWPWLMVFLRGLRRNAGVMNKIL